MHHFFRLTPAILALTLVSSTPAFPKTHRSAAPRTASFAETLRSFLLDLECSADPLGGACRPTPTAHAARPRVTSLRSDVGCRADPWGRCLPETQTTSGH
jgi:hypothetical protein